MVGKMVKRKADGVERVYELARRRAMEFAYRPGEKVKEGELAAEFGVSRIPVREALNRLVTEGFMSFVPNRGFFCRDIDAGEIWALYEVRAALETWAYRTACRAADEAGLAEFCACWGAEETVARFETLNAYDAEFHAAMAGLCGNALLTRQLGQIADKIFAFRNLELEDVARRTKTLNEHGRILELLSARECAEGARMLEAHILGSAENAIAAARQRFSVR